MSFLEGAEAPTNLQEPEFHFLVEYLFSKLDGVSKETLGNFRNVTNKKIYFIERFIKSFRIHIGDDMYPSARLIMPTKDGRSYAIKDVTLARHIVKIFKIPKGSEDYDVLYNWKGDYQNLKYHGKSRKVLRSLPLIASRIISNRRQLMTREPSRPIKVSELNQYLDDMAADTSSAKQGDILTHLLTTLPIEEIRWFLNIVLKVSILNKFESIFFQKWHPDGAKLYQICNSLSKTFQYLISPDKRLTDEQLTVKPMLPFLPQLSYKLTTDYDDLCAKMKTRYEMDDSLTKIYDELSLDNKFYVEEKMDGDRMIMHMENNKFKFFTRRLKEYTLLYGENLHIGALTKYLGDAFLPGVKSVILDGEMVAWDFKRNVILPFGTLKSSAIQEAVAQFTTTDQYLEQSSYPFFLAFDMLHLNGKNLTNMPLFYRKHLLNQVIKPVPHRLEVLQVNLATTSDDIKDCIRKIVSERCEGIMIKHVQSKYTINNRSSNWIKIKPEYLEQFGENLDLVVIGKEPGIKNSYMVSLRDDDVYKSFCMVANGFSEKDYDKIERLTFNKWHDFKKMEPPAILQFGSKKPRQWIHPDNSVVLEIKARSVDTSSDSSYAVGSSLHNLYCRRIREDKLPRDCITLNEYKSLKESYANDLDKSQSINKRKRSIQSSFTDSRKKIAKTQADYSLFNGLNFLILSDRVSKNSERVSIDELKLMVKKYGGRLVQSPRNNEEGQTVIISDLLLPKCEIYLKKGFDLIRPLWIFECIRRQAIVQIEPILIFKTKNKNFVNSSKVDQFGDSWIVHSNPKTNGIRDLVIPDKLLPEQFTQSREEFNEDLQNLGIETPLFMLFHKLNFFIVCPSHQDQRRAYLEDRIQIYGGQICLEYKLASFIVVPEFLSENESFRPWVSQFVSKIAADLANNLQFTDKPNKIPYIVKEPFIASSIEHRCLPDAQDFKYI